MCQIITDTEVKCAKGKIQDQRKYFYENLTHTVKKGFELKGLTLDETRVHT